MLSKRKFSLLFMVMMYVMAYVMVDVSVCMCAKCLPHALIGKASFPLGYIDKIDVISCCVRVYMDDVNRACNTHALIR